MRITNKNALKWGDYFDIDFNVVSFNEWKDGLKIELEHGKKYGNVTNVTNDSLKKTAKIAIAHLIEDPKYYYYLVKLENKRKEYWLKNKKPSIFIKEN